MNQVYRLVWSRQLNAPVVVAEIAGAEGKPSSARQRRSGRVLRRAALALATALSAALSAPVALALPSGGQVVAGKAALHQSANRLTVDQTTPKAILNWQRFGIGQGQTVTFNQPGSSSVALNRVVGNSASAIYGHLDANGQVFLVNPNGVYFAPGARVDVGGIVASTLGISNSDFLNGNYRFSGASKAGVVNAGQIRAAQGGYIAFIGNHVSNSGALSSPGGTTALGAGGRVDLTLAGNSLVHFAVSQSALDAMVSNGGAITAKGGRVVLSARAKDALLRTVVNNTGVIRAQGVARHGGVIELLGGHSGTTEVAGTLDTTPASNGAVSGRIETSGAHLRIGKASIHAGAGGQWLVDPVDLTIDTNAATAIDSALNSNTSVTEQTTASSASGQGTQASGNGDINVNAPISWSTGATLTLSAYHSLNINAAISGTGTSSALVLDYNNNGGTSTGGTLNIASPVTLSGSSAALTINGTGYTLIQNMTGLQNMQNGLAGHYALGQDLTDTTTTGSGFTPIATFTGTFEGLGHTISGLYINSAAGNAGLFGYVGTGGVIRDVGLVGGSVTGGGSNVGELAGFIGTNATITNAYATGSVSGSKNVGGLVGFVSYGAAVSNSYATGTVTGSAANIGGLVGQVSNGALNNDYATGDVIGSSASIQVGGLVGDAVVPGGSTWKFLSASGNVTGHAGVGGLIGYASSNGTVSNAYAVGSLTAVGSSNKYFGGLVGDVYTTHFVNTYAAGAVPTTAAASNVGGLAGVINSGGGSPPAIGTQPPRAAAPTAVARPPALRVTPPSSLLPPACRRCLVVFRVRGPTPAAW